MTKKNLLEFDEGKNLLGFDKKTTSHLILYFHEFFDPLEQIKSKKYLLLFDWLLHSKNEFFF